jgi:hypothetical protein
MGIVSSPLVGLYCITGQSFKEFIRAIANRVPLSCGFYNNEAIGHQIMASLFLRMKSYFNKSIKEQEGRDALRERSYGSLLKRNRLPTISVTRMPEANFSGVACKPELSQPVK